MTYVELHCHSAYSFLDGASQPEELAARAAELGYEALALTDHDGVYGSLEFAHAAKHFGVRPITGAEVTLDGGAHVTLLVETRTGYANLCRLLTAAHAHTRDTTNREPLPPALDRAARGAERGARLPLRLRARRARASATRTQPRGSRAPSAATASSSSCSGRSSAATRAATRAARSRRDARRRAPSPPATSTRTTAPRRAAGRARRDPLPHLARRLRAGAARQPRVRPAAPADMVERFPDDRDAVARTAELAERLEFDLTRGARLPLSRLLRRRRAGDRAAEPRLRARVRRALLRPATATSGACARGSTRSSR